jgi:hypothetical protein
MALEQALLYLHETGILQLDKGRSVFRAAMTIELLGEADKRRWRKEDLESLQAHDLERNLQIHVMHEYARLGVQDIDAAQDFVAAYLALPCERRSGNAHIRRQSAVFDLKRQTCDCATCAVPGDQATSCAVSGQSGAAITARSADARQRPTRRHRHAAWASAWPGFGGPTPPAVPAARHSPRHSCCEPPHG